MSHGVHKTAQSCTANFYSYFDEDFHYSSCSCLCRISLCCATGDHNYNGVADPDSSLVLPSGWLMLQCHPSWTTRYPRVLPRRNL